MRKNLDSYVSELFLSTKFENSAKIAQNKGKPMHTLTFCSFKGGTCKTMSNRWTIRQIRRSMRIEKKFRTGAEVSFLIDTIEYMYLKEACRRLGVSVQDFVLKQVQQGIYDFEDARFLGRFCEDNDSNETELIHLKEFRSRFKI